MKSFKYYELPVSQDVFKESLIPIQIITGNNTEIIEHAFVDDASRISPTKHDGPSGHVLWG